MDERRIVFVVGNDRHHAFSVLYQFRHDFNEHVKTYNDHIGEVTLFDNTKIIAIKAQDQELRTKGIRFYKIFGADYFLEMCYRKAYYILKRRYEKLEKPI